MKEFYVSLYLMIKAEDINAAYDKAIELADQALESLDECVLECRPGEVEECEAETSEEE